MRTVRSRTEHPKYIYAILPFLLILALGVGTLAASAPQDAASDADGVSSVEYDSIVVDPQNAPPPFQPPTGASKAHFVPSVIAADGSETSTLWILWQDANGQPVAGRPNDVVVKVRNEGAGISVGPVIEEGDGYYTVSVRSTRPGSTYAIVTLAGEELAKAPALHMSADAGSQQVPIVTRSREQVTFFAGDGPVVLDENLQILGLSGSTPLRGFRVAIAEGFTPGDQLGFLLGGEFFPDYHADGISGTYSPAEGILNLTGLSTVDNYLKALRLIAFRTLSDDPEVFAHPRSVSFTLVPAEAPDVVYNEATGRYYRYVTQPMTWEQAELAAAQMTLFGLQGYLVTITSAEENELVRALTGGQEVWLGGAHNGWASNQPHDGKFRWYWAAGPETGMQFSAHHFDVGAYKNWRAGRPRGDDGRAHVFMNGSGQWEDDYETALKGFVVEFGGIVSSGARLTEYITIDLVELPPPPTVRFTYEPAYPRFGEPVQFTATATGSGLAYTWNYGDGSAPAYEEHPSHTYAKPGTYSVRLSVEDKYGRIAVSEAVVPVTADLLGYVFRDANANGLRDAGEAGLGLEQLQVALVREGEVVAVAPSPGCGHSFDPVTGEYRFERVTAGHYDVVVIRADEPESPWIPAGWLYTGTASHTPDVAINLHLLPVFGTGILAGPDFGFTPGIEVYGTVFRDDGGTGDQPNDGAKGSTEQGVGGLRLRAVLEGGAVVDSTLSDAQGGYRLRIPGEDPAVSIRLVLGNGTNFRPTGFTPGHATDPVQLSEFVAYVDVPVTLGAANGAYEGYDFGVVPALAWSRLDSGSAPRGGLKAYPFTLTLGTVGTVSFSVSSSRGWDYAVYIDTNADGKLDAQDQFIGYATDPLGPGTVPFILAVRIPTSEADGVSDAVRVEATLHYAGSETLHEVATLFGITTVSSSLLDLVVGVRNRTQNLPPGPDNYSTRQVEAALGDRLEYQVLYENRGTHPVTAVIVRTAIPEGTRLVEDAYGLGWSLYWEPHDGSEPCQPVAVRDGNVLILQLGDILPGQRGRLISQVAVD